MSAPEEEDLEPPEFEGTYSYPIGAFPPAPERLALAEVGDAGTGHGAYEYRSGN